MPRAVVTYTTTTGAFDANGTALAVTISPLTADLDAGGFKITNLADGTAASDAAAFGQIAAGQVQWSVLTNGDPTTPELVFTGGDVIMVNP